MGRFVTDPLACSYAYPKGLGAPLTKEFAQSGTIKQPDLGDLINKLELCMKYEGSVTLEDEVDGSEKSLRVEADKAQYLITLAEETSNGLVVRGFENEAAEKRKVAVLGDLWNDRAICRDPSVVISAFEEFLNTGDVSRELLT